MGVDGKKLGGGRWQESLSFIRRHEKSQHLVG